LSAERHSNSDTASRIAGISGGTGIVGLVALIPEDYHGLKQALTYLSPTASIVIAILWSWGSGLLVSWLDQLQFDQSLRRVRELRDQILANPHSSEQHRTRAQENVEALEQLAFAIVKDNTQALHASLARAGTQNPSDPPRPEKGAAE